ncbi:MAG: chemotaxis protein CheW [Gallionellaceae bacterium]|nr:chemotaxis protein CheW [Gallionellaceae bacterium]
MEESLTLREFQTRLAERLKGAASQDGATAKLGFVAGGRHWLTALDQVGEVVTVTRLARAPWTRPWFIGVASVRGAIYGCTDLAAYLGVAPAGAPDETRLLLANARFGAHAAFRIDQALGLRNVAGMTPVPLVDDHAPWLLARFVDGEGIEWTEIALENLLAEPRFVQVAA